MALTQERINELSKELNGKWSTIARMIAKDNGADWEIEDFEWPEVVWPVVCFEYANEIINGEFLEGEELIATNLDLAIDYAVNVIKKPFPAAEELMATVSYTALDYAQNVLKGRFEKAEAEILTDPYATIDYAVYVVKERWPEAESVLIEAGEGYHIGRYFPLLNGKRWPEAEEEILKHPRLSAEYAAVILKERWPEAEEGILFNAYAAKDYAVNVLKERWPEAEEVIKLEKSEGCMRAYVQELIGEDLTSAFDLLDYSVAEIYWYVTMVHTKPLKEIPEEIRNDMYYFKLYRENVLNEFDSVEPVVVDNIDTTRPLSQV